MSCPVVHFEITGSDGEGLKKFYADVFGWKINSDNPMNYGLVDKEEGGIAGGISDAMEGGGPSATFYISVDGIDDYLKTIENHGGTIIVPRTDIPGMVTFAQFQDPEGNMIGVVDSKMPEA